MSHQALPRPGALARQQAGRFHRDLVSLGELFAVGLEALRRTWDIRAWFWEFVEQCAFLARVTSLPVILVNQAFEEGRMPEAEFREREAELLARLREVREHHRAIARAAAEESAGAAVDEKRRVVIDIPDEIR